MVPLRCLPFGLVGFHHDGVFWLSLLGGSSVVAPFLGVASLQKRRSVGRSGSPVGCKQPLRLSPPSGECKCAASERLSSGEEREAGRQGKGEGWAAWVGRGFLIVTMRFHGFCSPALQTVVCMFNPLLLLSYPPSPFHPPRSIRPPGLRADRLPFPPEQRRRSAFLGKIAVLGWNGDEGRTASTSAAAALNVGFRLPFPRPRSPHSHDPPIRRQTTST